MQGKTARKDLDAGRSVGTFNEAPARMQGKTNQSERSANVFRHPSMRPLHECRGKLVDRDLLRSVLSPFNEAPARMQGKTCCASTKTRPIGSFNEAPARMQGKTSQRANPVKPLPAFNEAPARMQGKTDVINDAVRLREVLQ